MSIATTSTPEIAVLFDRMNGALLRYGLAQHVQSAYETMRKTLTDARFELMANSLAVITMPATDEAIELVHDLAAHDGSALKLLQLKALDCRVAAGAPI